MSAIYDFGSYTRFCEFGKYLKKIKNKQERIHICSDNFYMNSTVENLMSFEFSGLMRLEIAYNVDFPFTVYL